MLAYVQYGCADQATVKQLGRLWWVLELRLPVADWYRLQGLSVSPGADSLLSDTCSASELLSTAHRWSSTSSLVYLYSSDTAFSTCCCFRMAPVACPRLQALFDTSQSLCHSHFLQSGMSQSCPVSNTPNKAPLQSEYPLQYAVL